MDGEDTLRKSLERVARFCQERDWDQFHGPKDLAIGAITESSELLEIFRFKSEDEMARMLADPNVREKIGHELADVLFFLLRFAQKYDFDLLDEFESKMKRNEARYPIETSKGSNRKAPHLPISTEGRSPDAAL